MLSGTFLYKILKITNDSNTFEDNIILELESDELRGCTHNSFLNAFNYTVTITTILLLLNQERIIYRLFSLSVSCIFSCIAVMRAWKRLIFLQDYIAYNLRMHPVFKELRSKML